MLDGRISTLLTPSGWYSFYPNAASYRAIGPSPLPQVSPPIRDFYYHFLALDVLQLNMAKGEGGRMLLGELVLVSAENSEW